MLSSKIIRHRLLGAYYREDMCDRYGEHFPTLVRALYWRMHPRIRERRLIFIHVPRAAGTSICEAMFDGEDVGHHSIRSYRALEPDLFEAASSFALLRDPMDRFWSSWQFISRQGASVVGLSRAFRHLLSGVRTVDDYLDFIDGKPPLDLDFVMRPQTWFVTDARTRNPLVRNLFVLGRDDEPMNAFLRDLGVAQLTRANASVPIENELTAAQQSRVQRIYAEDFDLIGSLS